MQAEFNPNVNREELPGFLKNMAERVPYNEANMFAALAHPAVRDVKVSRIQPGDIVTIGNVKKKVARIDEHGHPVYEDLPKW